MKKCVAFILASISILAILVNPALAVPPPETPAPVYVFADGTVVESFKDLRDGDDDVILCKKNGVVFGCGDNRFCPERAITRAEYNQMLYKLSGSEHICLEAPLKYLVGNKAPWWFSAEDWTGSAWLVHYRNADSALKVALSRHLNGNRDSKPWGHEWEPWDTVTPEWAIIQAYLVELGASGTPCADTFQTDALAWAADHGIAMDGSWRHDLTQEGGDCISRSDACRLLVALYGLS